MIFASLLAKLGFDTTAWTSGANRAGQELDKLGKKSKGFFADLKKDFGKGSMLGQSLKLLAGGGAIAGVGLAARELANLGATIEEMSIQMRSGQKSFREFTEEGIRSIPILGNVTKFFDGLREAITGEKYAIDKQINAYERRTQANRDAIAKAEEYKKIALSTLREVETEAAKSKRASALLGIDNEFFREEWGVRFDIGDRLAKIRKDTADAIKQSEIDRLSKATDDPSRLKLNQLMKDRELLIKAQADAELALEQEQADRIAEIRRKMDQKIAEDAAKTARELREKQITELEVRKQQLTDIISASKSMDHEFGTQTTSNMRFGGTVQLQPKPNNPMQKIAEASLNELKGINQKIADIKHEEEVSASF